MSAETEFMRCISQGNTPNAAQLESYLVSFHRERRGATSNVFLNMRDKHGQTSYQRLAAAVLDGMPRDVLEVGCGDGELMAALLSESDHVRVSGVDICDAEILRARDRLPPQRVASLEVAHASRLPFQDASFDSVALHMVLMLLPDAPAALREVRRVLRNNGTLAFVVPRGGATSGVPSLSSIMGNVLRQAAPSIVRYDPHGGQTDSDMTIRSVLGSCGFCIKNMTDLELRAFVTGEEIVEWLRCFYVLGSMESPAVEKSLGNILTRYPAPLQISEALRLVCANAS